MVDHSISLLNTVKWFRISNFHVCSKPLQAMTTNDSFGLNTRAFFRLILMLYGSMPHCSSPCFVTPDFPFSLWWLLFILFHGLCPLILEVRGGSVLSSPLTLCVYSTDILFPLWLQASVLMLVTLKPISSQDLAALEIRLFTDWLHMNEHQESITQWVHLVPFCPHCLLSYCSGTTCRAAR